MVRIITDTTSCLSPEIAKKYNIAVIPQIINFGDDTFMEGIDMNTTTFLLRLRTSPELPKTSAPPPELFMQELERLVPLGEPILCLHPSEEVSGTVRSAMMAAKEFPNADIRVIDTRLIASPLGTLVQLAAEWAASGVDVSTIETRLSEMIPRARIYFLVATLEYLAKGGRIGGAAALVGSVLQIKPILAFRNGKVDLLERERTHKRALERLKELVFSQISQDKESYLTVLHAGVPEQGQALAEDLCARLHCQNIPIHNMPPAIITHGGPGILGVAFFT
jgi:DegV family protein with EDD domain